MKSLGFALEATSITKKGMNKILGQKLKFQRENLGFSQRFVAEFLGVSPSFVSKIELGVTDLRVSFLIQMVNLYDISYDELFKYAMTTQENRINALKTAETKLRSCKDENTNLRAKLISIYQEQK